MGDFSAAVEPVMAVARTAAPLSNISLQGLQAAPRRRLAGIVIARALPWFALALALAWRLGGQGGWLLALLPLALAFASARRGWQQVDSRWLARELDSRRSDLEDSSALLFMPAAELSALGRLQRERVQQRLLVGPLPDLRPGWPARYLLWNSVAGLTLAALALFAPWPGGRPPPAPPPPRAAPPADNVLRLLDQELAILPPAYTGAPARRVATLQATVPEGAELTWNLRFSRQPRGATLVFHDGVRLPLQRRGEEWTARRILRKSSLYRIVPEGSGPFVDARLHRLNVTADLPPKIRVIEPDRSLTLLKTGQGRWLLAFEATDDFGLGAAHLRVTLAQGSGENISFSARILDLPGQGSARRRSYRLHLDLASQGFAVGDDLVVRLSVNDRRRPSPQTTRSASFILRWPRDTGAEASGVDGLVKKVLPAYFRSQRQIIIDSEALMTERPRPGSGKFLERSEQIGVDQRILRLRYGQFLGEESSGEPEAPPGATPGAAGDPQTAAAGTDAHGHDQAAPPPTATGDATSVVEAFGHSHDEAEAATLLDPETREVLRAALGEMWQAELHLRQGDPKQALPFEYRALRLIKQVQQASRIYLPKVGLELAPVDMARRLSGDRAGLQSRPDSLVAAQSGASAALALWQVLASPAATPDLAELDRFELWLREKQSSVPQALDLFALTDAWRMAPECRSCAASLRRKLWSLLPGTVPAVIRRPAAGRSGSAYLDALQDGGSAAPNAAGSATPVVRQKSAGSTR